MSSDETAKIEPTLTDTPSIAPEAKPEGPKSEAPESPKTEAVPEIKIEAKPEAAKIEATIEPKAEARTEVPTLPPAPQIEPPKAVVPLRRPGPKTDQPAAQGRNSRFALLAASVAIAASLGAIGGSLGVAKFGAVFGSQAKPVAAAKDPAADEIKSLKDSVAQLRLHMRSLTENVAALKTTMNTTNAAAGQQSTRITEALERIEKTQAEQKKLAAQPIPSVSTTEITGTIAQKQQQQQQQQQQQAVPMVLGDPPTTLKPPILQDYVVRRVYNDGAALIEGRRGMIEVEPGTPVPGLGRIEAIKRQDGRWVVVTPRGLIVQR